MSERAAALVIGASVGGFVGGGLSGARRIAYACCWKRAQAPREPDGRADRARSAHGDRTAAVCAGPVFRGARSSHGGGGRYAAAAGTRSVCGQRRAWPNSAMPTRWPGPLYRRRLTAEARRLRRWWWTAPEEGMPDAALERGRARELSIVFAFPAPTPICGARFETRRCWRRCCGMRARAALRSASPARRWRWSGARRRKWRACRTRPPSRSPARLIGFPEAARWAWRSCAPMRG